MSSNSFWQQGFFLRTEPRFRKAARRMVFTYVIAATALAVLMCVGTHVVIDALGLLPYPIWPAVLIGSIMAGLFAASIMAIAVRYAANAYYQLEAAREQFERLSRTDTLTGLLNRRAFLQAFADTPGVAALALFDIDHFKAVNDRFGHAGGDAALVETTRVLAAGFAAPDVVARIGGEEFAVLIASCMGDDATALVDRARRAVGARRIGFEIHEFAVTVSGGIAHVVAGESPDIDALLPAADRALYLAKAQGRDRLVDAGSLAVLRPSVGQSRASRANRDAVSDDVSHQTAAPPRPREPS